MNPKIKLDAIDRKILTILQKNAKITNAQLAIEIGLSPAPTLERVKKLENTGIIKSYHAKLDTHNVGLGVSTYVMVSLAGHNKKNTERFISSIEAIDEIIECHHITGSADFILKIVTSDMPAYQELILGKMTDFDVVANMQSMVIMATYKDSKALPIP